MLTNRMRRRIITEHVGRTIVLTLEVNTDWFPLLLQCVYLASQGLYLQIRRGSEPGQLRVVGIKLQMLGFLTALDMFPQPIAVSSPNATALWLPMSVVRQQLSEELSELEAWVHHGSFAKGVVN